MGENPVSVFGSSKAPALEMAIVGLLAHIKGVRTFADLGEDLSSAMTYLAIPHTQDRAQIQSLFENLDPACRFHAKHESGCDALLTLHAGYIYGPLDCSAWMSQITGSPRFVTRDITLLVSGAQEWLATEQGLYLSQKFKRIDVKNPQEDIKAGQMWHKGGHVALILGISIDPNNTSITLLGRNRTMPGIEGFGVEKRLYSADMNILDVS